MTTKDCAPQHKKTQIRTLSTHVGYEWAFRCYKASANQQTSPLTGTGAVRHQGVAVEAVAHVAAMGVHTAVFTGPGLQAAFVQI